MIEHWRSVSSLLPALLASLASGGCARVALDDPDAGIVTPPSLVTVTGVAPQPGTVPGDAHFEVTFSAPMDLGQLLATSGRSETVVLVVEADVERVAAAIARSHLTAAERALLVPAAAHVALDVLSIALAPDAPLPSGTFYLLVASRLRDAAGKRLDGNGARYRFDVQAVAPAPRLLAPPPGAQVPINLLRVRLQVPPGFDAGPVALVSSDGGQVAQASGGEIDLCSAAPCNALQAGESYALSVAGASVPDAGFTVADCSRTGPPALLGLELSPRDTSVMAQVTLDWPAMVRAQVTAQDCDGGCASAGVLLDCAPPGCGQGDAGTLCTGSLQLSGLAPATAYSLQLKAADDEGFVLIAPPRDFTTTALLPSVIISEVMSYPPAPTPRSPGQYVEILNTGTDPVDVTSLALLGPDGTVRPLIADAPSALMLAPGARALAVGAAFDQTRYPSLPSGTLLLHASTQRLLGRGIREQDPPAFALVEVQSGAPVVVADFPGGGLSCAEGASLQRDELSPAASPATWTCGALGGSPGRPP